VQRLARSSNQYTSDGLPLVYRVTKLIHFPTMITRFPATAVLTLVGILAAAQNPDLAQIKERELEQVREKISVLKASMDTCPQNPRQWVGGQPKIN
jgi:hypothetical protein